MKEGGIPRASRHFRAGIPHRTGYDPGVKFRPLALLLLFCALTGPARPQASEPPLPGEDESAPSDFQPLLEPGDTLPPDRQAPPEKNSRPLAPPELFPVESLGPDADGKVPGLILPDDRITPPGLPGLPGSPDPSPDGLLPPPSSIPGLELATVAYWHKNPREAREIAKKEQKPLLMLFCYDRRLSPTVVGKTAMADPTTALDADVLSSEDFKTFASGHLVLTRLLYPVGSPNEKDYPPAKLKALMDFKSFFKARMPCLILLDENGKEIERVSKYTRIKGSDGKELSAAGPILDRLKLAVHRREVVIANNRERMDRLRSQNYREWTSKSGSTLLAKLVSSSPGGITLMDEHGALFRVLPPQLCILDRAWIQRTHPPEKIVSSTSAAGQNP